MDSKEKEIRAEVLTEAREKVVKKLADLEINILVMERTPSDTIIGYSTKETEAGFCEKCHVKYSKQKEIKAIDQLETFRDNHKGGTERLNVIDILIKKNND